MKRFLRWAAAAALTYPLARYVHELYFEGDTLALLHETDDILAHLGKVALFFVLASISKDTAFPFLFLLAIAAGERRWKLLIGSAAAGAAVTLLFNYLKFGSIFNQAYLDPIFIVHSPAVQASFFLGIWFSPNGGVLFFWPAFFALLLIAGRTALRDRRRSVPFAIAIAVLAGLTAGFSR